MISEAIILAGGLGTRLRDAVPDLPKCMAPVAGKPFLFYLISHLKKQGISRFVFSLGYKNEAILDFLKDTLEATSYVTVIEDEPMGTGGAIALSLKAVSSTDVLIANGDTLFAADIRAMEELHEKSESVCTLALKPMTNFNRYGVVETAANRMITSFIEKRQFAEGLINGGLYLLNVPRFRQYEMPVKFSFEKEFLEKHLTEKRFYGLADDGYFIDIGIAEDFNRAQSELKPFA